MTGIAAASRASDPRRHRCDALAVRPGVWSRRTLSPGLGRRRRSVELRLKGRSCTGSLRWSRPTAGCATDVEPVCLSQGLAHAVPCGRLGSDGRVTASAAVSAGKGGKRFRLPVGLKASAVETGPQCRRPPGGIARVLLRSIAAGCPERFTGKRHDFSLRPDR